MWLGFQLTCSYLQCLPRHKGIGSLPSAITTACSARMAELPCRGLLIGIALYSPASATTVSRHSTTLFIGGVSFAHTSARGEVYARIEASWATRPVDNCRFLRARGFSHTHWKEQKRQSFSQVAGFRSWLAANCHSAHRPAVQTCNG
jgi:hypothetical protein